MMAVDHTASGGLQGVSENSRSRRVYFAKAWRFPEQGKPRCLGSYLLPENGDMINVFSLPILLKRIAHS
jgi:hypothetical protein